jgi:hypothetical protein
MCKALSAAAAFEARSRNPACGPAPEAMASVRGCLSQAFITCLAQGVSGMVAGGSYAQGWVFVRGWPGLAAGGE